jgi:hypothetical protein
LLAETLDAPAQAARAANGAPATSSAESASTNTQGPTSANATSTSGSQPDAAPLMRTSVSHPQSRVPASLAQAAFAAGDASGPADHVLKQVEGALARVELGQLASLRSDDAHAQMWLLELPVRSPDGETDVLQLRIGAHLLAVVRPFPGGNAPEREAGLDPPLAGDGDARAGGGRRRSSMRSAKRRWRACARTHRSGRGVDRARAQHRQPRLSRRRAGIVPAAARRTKAPARVEA